MSQSDPLAGLLGSLLGGGAAGGSGVQPGQPAQGGPAPDLGNLAAMLLGGATAAQPAPAAPAAQPAAGGDLGDLLGAFLGGQNLASSPILGAVAETLAAKLKLPPATVQLVLGFVVSKLVAALTSAQAPATGRAAAPAGLDMQGLLARAAQGKTVDTKTLKASGLAKELAEYAGMNSSTATKSLQVVLKSLGSAMGS